MSDDRTDSRQRWGLALGRVKLTYDGRTVQQVQAAFTGGRLVEPVSLMQHFGFASRPPVGSEIVGLFLGGDPVNGFAVASNDQATRPTDLQEGDASLYDKRGAHLWFKDGGPVLNGGGGAVTLENVTSITINGAQTITVNGAETLNVTATRAINFDTPTVIVTGDVVSDGTVLT